jgi:hypothetical protein
LLFELRQFSVILFSIAAVSENWYARGAHRQAAGHTRHTTMTSTGIFQTARFEKTVMSDVGQEKRQIVE